MKLDDCRIAVILSGYHANPRRQRDAQTARIPDRANAAFVHEQAQRPSIYRSYPYSRDVIHPTAAIDAKRMKQKQVEVDRLLDVAKRIANVIERFSYHATQKRTRGILQIVNELPSDIEHYYYQGDCIYSISTVNGQQITRPIVFVGRMAPVSLDPKGTCDTYHGGYHRELPRDTSQEHVRIDGLLDPEDIFVIPLPEPLLSARLCMMAEVAGYQPMPLLSVHGIINNQNDPYQMTSIHNDVEATLAAAIQMSFNGKWYTPSYQLDLSQFQG